MNHQFNKSSFFTLTCILSLSHTHTQSLTLNQVIQTGHDPDAAGQEFCKSKKLRPLLTRSSCQLGKVPQMKIIISCRTGQTHCCCTPVQRSGCPFKTKRNHMCSLWTHTCTYCKLSPVCLPSSLALSICLYLCVTLFSSRSLLVITLCPV